MPFIKREWQSNVTHIFQISWTNSPPWFFEMSRFAWVFEPNLSIMVWFPQLFVPVTLSRPHSSGSPSIPVRSRAVCVRCLRVHTSVFTWDTRVQDLHRLFLSSSFRISPSISNWELDWSVGSQATCKCGSSLVRERSSERRCRHRRRRCCVLAREKTASNSDVRGPNPIAEYFMAYHYCLRRPTFSV